MHVKQNDNLKIFIGPTEIASIGVILARAFREIGIRVTVVTMGIFIHQPNMNYDVVMDFQGLNILQNIYKRLCHFLKFFLRHNTFIFLFGNSLLPYNLDLPILKLFRKKTIMLFLGSDIRHYESIEIAIKKLGIKYQQSEARKDSQEKVNRKKIMIRRVEKYIGYIFTGQSISHLLTKNYYKLYIPIDINNIRYNNNPNPKPIVVHAPTNDKRKGTSHILRVVEQLKQEGYDFEFSLFRNTSNIKVREILSAADIAIDSVFNLEPGMFSIEAMASGCAVLGGNIPEFSGLPQEIPIIHTDLNNIYQNLKLLLENQEMRRELGKRGRQYVEKYHDSRKIANDILQLLSGNAENLVLCEPTD